MIRWAQGSSARQAMAQGRPSGLRLETAERRDGNGLDTLNVMALLPSGAPLGFVAILGVLAVIGILIRNSVILIVLLVP
jgi:hypothetical protein